MQKRGTLNPSFLLCPQDCISVVEHYIPVKIGCKHKPQYIRQHYKCCTPFYHVCTYKIEQHEHIQQQNIHKPHCACGGLGVVLCKNLAEQGAKLSISGTNAEKLNALAEELSKTTEVFAQVVDVTSVEELTAALYNTKAGDEVALSIYRGIRRILRRSCRILRGNGSRSLRILQG